MTALTPFKNKRNNHPWSVQLCIAFVFMNSIAIQCLCLIGYIDLEGERLRWGINPLNTIIAISGIYGFWVGTKVDKYLLDSPAIGEHQSNRFNLVFFIISFVLLSSIIMFFLPVFFRR